MPARLVSVGDEQAFWFKDWDGSVDFVAHNIKEFKKALKSVPESSLEFHMREDKNDFSVWLSSVLQQENVAERMQAVKALNLKGNDLREALLKCFRPARRVRKKHHNSKSLREAIVG
ncbi:MAG: hypothetical protein J7L23_05235 [Candidatus Diapherotrites archaeon]|nr:hypothetical protein [Candidatus Diapherotrites archaeon]